MQSGPNSPDYGTPEWNRKYAELKEIIREKLAPAPEKKEKR